MFERDRFRDRISWINRTQGQGEHKDLLAGGKETKISKPIIGLQGNYLQLTSGKIEL